MTLRYLLDTNIVSYFLRRSSAVLEQRMVLALQHQECALSAITRAELRYGQAAMAADDRRRMLVDGVLLQLPCLPWTHAAADRYGELKDFLRRQGRPIGELDTQIAAQALAEELVLVTHNTRHFTALPGLALQDWMLEQGGAPVA